MRNCDANLSQVLFHQLWSNCWIIELEYFLFWKEGLLVFSMLRFDLISLCYLTVNIQCHNIYCTLCLGLRLMYFFLIITLPFLCCFFFPFSFYSQHLLIMSFDIWLAGWMPCAPSDLHCCADAHDIASRYQHCNAEATRHMNISTLTSCLCCCFCRYISLWYCFISWKNHHNTPYFKSYQ